MLFAEVRLFQKLLMATFSGFGTDAFSPCIPLLIWSSSSAAAILEIDASAIGRALPGNEGSDRQRHHTSVSYHC